MLRPSRPPLGRGFCRAADRIRNNFTPKSHRKRLVSLACQGLRIILGSVTSRSIAASKSARSDVRIAATSNVAFVRGRGPATAPADSVQVSFPWQPHVLYVRAQWQAWWLAQWSPEGAAARHRKRDPDNVLAMASSGNCRAQTGRGPKRLWQKDHQMRTEQGGSLKAHGATR